MSRQIDALYWELSMVADGMGPGKAAAVAALKAIDDAAIHTGEEIDKVAAKTVAGAKKQAQAVTSLREAQKKWLDEIRGQKGGRDVSGPNSQLPDIFKVTPGQARKAAREGEKLARDLISGITQTFDNRKSEIRESVARGLLTPAEARQQGAAAARAYNLGILSTIEKAGDRGQLSGLKGQTTLNALTRQLQDVDVVAVKTSRGLGRLREPLVSLATQAIGVRSSVGSLVSQLGMLGLGAVTTLAAVAGVAAIAHIYNVLAAGAKKAKEELAGVIDKLRQAREERLKDTEDARLAIVLQAQLNEQQVATRLGKARAAVVPDRGQVRELEKELGKAADATNEAELQLEGARTTRGEREASRLGRLLTAQKANAQEVERAAELLKQYNAELKAISGTDEAAQEKRLRLIGMINDLTAVAKEDAKRNEKEETRVAGIGGVMEQLEGLKASLTPAAADNLTVRLDALWASLRKLKPTPEEIAAFKALRAEIQGLAADRTAEEVGRQIRDMTAASTVTAVDDIKNGLADLKKALREKGATDEQIAQIEALQTSMIGVTAETEKFVIALEAIDQATKLGFNLGGQLDQLRGLLEEQQTLRDRAPEGSVERATAQKRINDLIEREAALMKQIRDLQRQINGENRKFSADLEGVTGQIANAANAAFGLASAFLGVDSNVTKALGSIGQLAGGINAVSGLATQAGGFGKLLSTGSGIVSALPGIGMAIGGAMALAGSLFGKDPQVERARQETLAGMKELRSALIELKDTYLQNVSSVDVAADIATTRRILEGIGTGAFGEMTFGGNRVLGSGVGSGPGRRGNLRDIGRSIGQDFDSGALLAYFKQLDSKYGTNLASFIEREDPYGLLQALRDVPAALQTELGELGRFADDATGTIAKVNYGLDLLGRSNAGERFRAIIKGLTDAGISMGEFADEFAELADPSTTAARVEEIVAAVLDRVNAGGADFGDLTPEELRDLFKQGVDASREGLEGTGGFNVSRTITEVTGNRLEALFTTGNVFAEQTAQNTALIARFLGGPTLIQPPAFAAAGLAAGGGGPLVQIDNLILQLGSLTDPGRAQEIASRVGPMVAEEIDRALGQRLRFAKLARGQLN